MTPARCPEGGGAIVLIAAGGWDALAGNRFPRAAGSGARAQKRRRSLGYFHVNNVIRAMFYLFTKQLLNACVS
jgi:hypothetical protein